MFRKLSPEKVYVTEDVHEDPRATACVDRLMTAIEGTTAETVSYDELNRIARERWRAHRGCGWRWGMQSDPHDPDMVFTTAKFWPEEKRQAFAKNYPYLNARDLYGFGAVSWRRDGSPEFRRETKGCICHSAWQLHSISGCPFRCAYCWFGGLCRVMVNMEAYVEQLDEICAREPYQRLYKWDNQTDVTAFEPEYGASKLLVEYFARKPDKYLEIYVGKSDNTNNLLELDHRGKTILQWSLSPRTQASMIEPETASWDRRIEAAHACGEAGYITRFRFSPMIPVRNWREEYAELIERIFARTSPDVISLCAFGWMDAATAKECIDFNLLDPEIVAAMEAEAPFLARRGFTAGGGRPIPHEPRAAMFKFVIDEIRKHNKTIPVSLCLETVEMWALFERELGMPVDPAKPSTYYCNCGPLCTPEHPLSRGVTPGPSWFTE